jgi:hypothetical protein
MTDSEAERVRLTLVIAEYNLWELSELLDASLRVERDICQRIRDGEASGDLFSQRNHYAQTISRILDGYFRALDEYLLAASESVRIEPGDGISNRDSTFSEGAGQIREIIRRIVDMRATQPTALERLQEDVERTRAEWLEAMTKFNEIINEIPGQIPEPDGSLRISRARRKQSVALRVYQEAFDRYTEEVIRSAGGGRDAARGLGPGERSN